MEEEVAGGVEDDLDIDFLEDDDQFEEFALDTRPLVATPRGSLAMKLGHKKVKAQDWDDEDVDEDFDSTLMSEIGLMDTNEDYAALLIHEMGCADPNALKEDDDGAFFSSSSSSSSSSSTTTTTTPPLSRNSSQGKPAFVRQRSQNSCVACSGTGKLENGKGKCIGCDGTGKRQKATGGTSPMRLDRRDSRPQKQMLPTTNPTLAMNTSGSYNKPYNYTPRGSRTTPRGSKQQGPRRSSVKQNKNMDLVGEEPNDENKDTNSDKKNKTKKDSKKK